MKKKDLEKKLSKLGWYLLHHRGKRHYWAKEEIQKAIPRHREINEILAVKILRTAEKNPPKK